MQRFSKNPLFTLPSLIYPTIPVFPVGWQPWEHIPTSLSWHYEANQMRQSREGGQVIVLTTSVIYSGQYCSLTLWSV